MKENIDNLINESLIILKKNNKVELKKKLKFLIINKKIYTADKLFWPNALLLNGLLMQNKFDKSFIKKINKLCNNKIKVYDDSLMVYILMKNSKKFEIKKLKMLSENMYSKLEEYYGFEIPYREKNKDIIFIDILGMVPPFLCLYGINKNDDGIIQWAVKLFELFIQKGFDSEFNVPFHAYNKKSNEKLGIIGWGRSLGWILFGMSECIDCLYKNHNNNYNSILNFYYKILEKINKYLRSDNGFSWQIISKESNLDTSATSLILLSMLNLKKNSLLNNKYNEQLKQMVNCLNDNIKDGKVYNCSAECMGLGLYPQIYNSYAWSVGPTLSCLKTLELLKEEFNNE